MFGDGEMDEPESIGALTLAAREQLDNLTFVINCNLQRLDGPVRGNGQIIQELERPVHRRRLERHQGAVGLGLGRAVRARSPTMRCCGSFAATVDGQYQTLGANDGAYNHAHFFELDPELAGAGRAHVATRDRRAASAAATTCASCYAAFARRAEHRRAARP